MNNTAFKIPGVKPGSDDEKMFCAIGFIVIQWGHCEQCLDLMVAFIHPCLGNGDEQKRPPMMLDEKLKKLDKWIKEIEWLSPLLATAPPIFKKFKNLSSIRHDLIHGAISDFELKNDCLSFVKLDIINKQYQIRPVEVTDQAFQSLRRNLLRLGEEVGQLSRQTRDIAKKYRP